jgi:hypothetical protein
MKRGTLGNLRGVPSIEPVFHVFDSAGIALSSAVQTVTRRRLLEETALTGAAVQREVALPELQYKLFF